MAITLIAGVHVRVTIDFILWAARIVPLNFTIYNGNVSQFLKADAVIYQRILFKDLQDHGISKVKK